MTICGYSIAPGGKRAVAWADTEIFRSEKPVGHQVKLAPNVAAMVVGIGAGYGSILDAVDRALMKAAGFDGLVDVIPDLMQHRAVQVGKKKDADAPSGATYAIVGWSHQYKRISGYIFCSSNCFSPMAATSWMAPEVEGMPPDGSTDAVISTACDQLAQLRRWNPEATGGALTQADIQPEGIALKQVYDLKNGRALSWPMNFQATNGAAP